MSKTLTLKKGDMIIIAVLLLASLLSLAVLTWQNSSAQGLSAEIYLEGQLLQTIALQNGEQELRLESVAGYNVLHIGEQGIRIVEADCHNQDCVHAGLQSRSGSIITCLPHRLLILLSGAKEAEFDAISR